MSAKIREVPIEQAIIRNPLTISAHETVAAAIALMSAGNQACKLLCEIDSGISSQLANAQGSCILVTEGKRLIGILTERDLVKFCGQHSDRQKSVGQSLVETAIAEVMVFPVYSLLEWEFTDILVPINRFHRYNIRHLPVVNNLGEVVGLLTHESLRQLLRPVDMLRLLKVSEVMTANAIHAQPTDSLTKIANLMSEHNVSSVVIVEGQDRDLLPLGIITEGDLVQYLALALDLSATQAQMVMSFPITSVGLDENLWTIRELMQEQMINHIAVTNIDGKMEGIITQSAILKSLQPTEVYKLISILDNKMSRLEKENLALSQSCNQLLESQVKEKTSTLSAIPNSNDYFQQFVENHPGAIFIREASSGKLLYVSPTYEEIWGQSSNDLYQNPDCWIQSIHPEDISIVTKILAADINDSFNEEFRIVCHDYNVKWLWGRRFPIKNVYGETYQIATIIEDITDRKQTQIALINSESELRNLFASMKDYIFILNQQGIYLKSFPNHPETICKVGHSLHENFPQQTADYFLAVIRDVLVSQQSKQIEYCITIQEQEIWFSTIVSPLGNETVLWVAREISDRKKAEIALRQSESKQKALINALPELIIRMSGDGIYLDFVPTDTFEVIGSEDLIGTSIYDSKLPKSAIESRMKHIRRALQTGDIQIYDQEIIVSGKVNIEEVRISVCGENEVLVIVRDISDRKRVETALKQSEQRLKASKSLLSGVFERSVVGMAITDIDGKFIKTNPFYQEMVGYSEIELESMRFTDNMLPEDIEENMRLRKLVLTGERESYQMEKRLLHRDGRVVWVRTTSSKIFDEINKASLFIGVIEDISDRKQAEIERQEAIDALYHLNQQLESRVEQRTCELKFANQQLIVEMAERQKLIALVENSTDFIALADRDGKLNYVNTAGLNLVGIKANINNLSIFDFHFPEDRQNLQENIINLVNQDESWEGEFRLRHCQTHEAIPVLFSAFSVQNSWIDETFSLAYIMRDISDRKKSEEIVVKTNETLVKTNTELARATRLKDEFLANMSHELRTPLNAILGMSEGLMTGVFGDLNERQRRSLSLIETSGKHLLELINDILDVVRIGAGKLKLELTSVSAEHLCKSSLNFVRQMATQKNIQLKLAIQSNVGEITVDERRLKQALINLLSNAVKFTPSGGKVILEAKIAKLDGVNLTTTAKIPYMLTFSIIDTGIGIATEDLSNLFQTFFQIDSSLSRQYEGTGLGLTLVKQIAELHGGSVSVTSKVGEGSCFSIFIPHTIKSIVKNYDYSHSSSAKGNNAAIVSDNSLEPHQELNFLVNPVILLAEDNPSNMETFSDYLSNRGYRLVFAADGQEAVDLAIAQVPDLILMDIQMPVLDGFSAIQRIRANPDLSHIPIVALTALAMASDREKCLQAGANEYLSKPVKLSQLVEIIQLQLKKTMLH